MSLRERIQEDMKSALRAGDRARLATVRLILAAIKQREVDERCVLDDTQVLAVLERMTKQRRESISQFRGAGREDLAVKEEAELVVIAEYLPQPLDAAELEALIERAIVECGAQGPRDMGKVMAAIKAAAAGRVDMSAVSALLKTRLAS